MANTKVTGDVIANGTISTVHIADDAITAAKLDSTATGITFADLAVDTDTLYVDSTNNRVGIGLTNPAVKLEIQDSTHTTIKIRSGNNDNILFAQAIQSQDSRIGTETNTNLSLYTNGSERMRITGSGNVGIGTTGPQRRLHINSTNESTGIFLERTSNYGFVQYNQIVGTTETYHLGFVNNNTFSSDILVANESGNVGIGLTNPSDKLAIDSSATGKYGLTISDIAGGGSERIKLQYEGSTGIGYITSTYNPGGADTATLKIQTGGSNDRIVVTRDGNVGIGTASPAEKLEVEGSSAIIKAQSTTAGANANIHFETTARKWGVGPNMALGSSDFEIYDYTAGQNRLVINSSGNVGIGTTSPESGAKLDVRAGAGGKVVFGSYDANYKVVIEAGDQLNFYNGTSSTLGYINYSQTATPGSLLLSRNLFVEANSNGGVTGTVRIKSNGDVGIGTTSPSQKLDVSGIVKQNGANNYENILVKSGSTGTFTFTQTELNSQMVDNVSYFIFVSVYRPTTDVTNDVGTLLLHGIMPRGSNSTFNTINTLKGSGISVLSATNSGNSLVITTDSGTTFRCAIRIIAMGGTS